MAENTLTVVATEAGPDETVRVVAVRGDVDMDSAPELERVLVEAARVPGRVTVVDLSGTGFADSTMLHVLLTAQRGHRAAGRRMVLAGPFGETVTRLLDVTGTAGFFEIVAGLDAVLGELPGARGD